MGRESKMTEGCVSFASHTLHREEGSGHAATVCVRRLTISLLKPLQVSVVDLGIGDGMFTCRQVKASSTFSAANHRDLPCSTNVLV